MAVIIGASFIIIDYDSEDLESFATTGEVVVVSNDKEMLRTVGMRLGMEEEENPPPYSSTSPR